MAGTPRAKAQQAEARLESKHAVLDARVGELEKRRALTDSEALELKKLKKEKLAAKDELSSRGNGRR